MGPFKIEIPFNEIIKVKAYRMFSTIRIISVKWKSGWKVYPADLDGFLNDLAEKIPSIDVPVK